MGRYREPQQPGSQYITPEGARRLHKELDELWRMERPRVTQAVAEAAAQGDRSENAEYTYGKRRLARDRPARAVPAQAARRDGRSSTSRRRIRSGCFSARGCRSKATTGR